MPSRPTLKFDVFLGEILDWQESPGPVHFYVQNVQKRGKTWRNRAIGKKPGNLPLPLSGVF